MAHSGQNALTYDLTEQVISQGRTRIKVRNMVQFLGRLPDRAKARPRLYVGSSVVTDVIDRITWVDTDVWPLSPAQRGAAYLRYCRSLAPPQQHSLKGVSTGKLPIAFRGRRTIKDAALVDITAAFYSLYANVGWGFRYNASPSRTFVVDDRYPFVRQDEWVSDKLARNTIPQILARSSFHVLEYGDPKDMRVSRKSDHYLPDVWNMICDVLREVMSQSFERYRFYSWNVDGGVMRMADTIDWIEWLREEWGLEGRVVHWGDCDVMGPASRSFDGQGEMPDLDFGPIVDDLESDYDMSWLAPRVRSIARPPAPMPDVAPPDWYKKLCKADFVGPETPVKATKGRLMLDNVEDNRLMAVQKDERLFCGRCYNYPKEWYVNPSGTPKCKYCATTLKKLKGIAVPTNIIQPSFFDPPAKSGVEIEVVRLPPPFRPPGSATRKAKYAAVWWRSRERSGVAVRPQKFRLECPVGSQIKIGYKMDNPFGFGSDRESWDIVSASDPIETIQIEDSNDLGIVIVVRGARLS